MFVVFTMESFFVAARSKLFVCWCCEIVLNLCTFFYTMECCEIVGFKFIFTCYCIFCFVR